MSKHNKFVTSFQVEPNHSLKVWKGNGKQKKLLNLSKQTFPFFD